MEEPSFPPVAPVPVLFGTPAPSQDITDEVEIHTRLTDEQARLGLAIGAAGLAIWELYVATNAITPSPRLNTAL